MAYLNFCDSMCQYKFGEAQSRVWSRSKQATFVEIIVLRRLCFSCSLPQVSWGEGFYDQTYLLIYITLCQTLPIHTSSVWVLSSYHHLTKYTHFYWFQVKEFHLPTHCTQEHQISQTSSSTYAVSQHCIHACPTPIAANRCLASFVSPHGGYRDSPLLTQHVLQHK